MEMAEALHVNPSNLFSHLSGKITSIDSHTAGEPTRLILAGVPALQGESIYEQMLDFKAKYDNMRTRLTCEPRGHRDMVAALLTPPASPGANFGLIYMDARRYPLLCGHATIGAVTTLIETGAIEVHGPGRSILVDTPSGQVKASVQMEGGRVKAVTIQLAPSFVYGKQQTLDVPGVGQLVVDTVCVGGFFVMATARQIDIPLEPAYANRLAEAGMAVIAAANEQLQVRDPSRPEVSTVDVAEFYELSAQPGHGKSAVVYGEAHVDRSPCGTGTAAKMALLYQRGELSLNQPYLNQGILGTTFLGRLVGKTRVGDLPAVIPEVTGSAYITGIHQFVVDPKDPFADGFLLG